jgi:hypothetical protein
MAPGAGSRMWWVRQWFWVSTSGWARCAVLRCRTPLRAGRGSGGAGVEHGLQGGLLGGLGFEAPVVLHRDPHLGVGAAVGGAGRLPGRGVFVAFGLVGVVGDGDQLGAGEVVGEGLPAAGGPGAGAGAPGFGEWDDVVDVDVGCGGPGGAVVGGVPAAGGGGAGGAGDDVGAVAFEDGLAGVAGAADGDPVREQFAVVGAGVGLGGDGQGVQLALRGGLAGDAGRGGGGGGGDQGGGQCAGGDGGDQVRAASHGGLPSVVRRGCKACRT